MGLALSPSSDPVLGGIQAALFSESTSAQVFTAEGRVMGTTARITTVGGIDELPRRMMEMLHDFDRQWSRFLADSEISKLNNSPGTPVAVSARTVELVNVMLHGHRITGGAFDPTLLPALLAEGYAASLVNPERVTSLPVGSQRRGSPHGVTVEGLQVTLPTGTTLDSGGAGKGLAADIVAKFARDNGALGAMVEVGGDLRVSGVSPRADSWRLAIEHPMEASRRLSVINVADAGVATSTVSKRRFVVDGRPTHHIIDPRTGLSADSDVLQATVIAPSAAQAEIATKIAFVDGYEKLFAFATHHNYQAACVTRSEQWITTKEWPEADA